MITEHSRHRFDLIRTRHWEHTGFRRSEVLRISMWRNMCLLLLKSNLRARRMNMWPEIPCGLTSTRTIISGFRWRGERWNTASFPKIIISIGTATDISSSDPAGIIHIPCRMGMRLFFAEKQFLTPTEEEKLRNILISTHSSKKTPGTQARFLSYASRLKIQPDNPFRKKNHSSCIGENCMPALISRNVSSARMNQTFFV